MADEVMEKLSKENHTCIECGKTLLTSKTKEHHTETSHEEYFQTYGSLTPNIRYFHYSQAMLRTFTKLLWGIDYSDLCEAVHLVTPKAKFMIEKQTDFRKGLDFVRSAQKAKLREMVTPYVKFCNTSVKTESKPGTC